jgi:signal transduction histidine kinase
MNYWHLLLTQEESLLYRQIQRSIIGGVIPYLLIQLIAYFLCTIIFFDSLSLIEHLLYGGALLLFSVVLLAHYSYGRKHKLWLNQGISKNGSGSASAMIWTLLYLLVGHIWWGLYVISLLRSGTHEIALIVVIAGIMGAFAISLMGGFRWIFILAISIVMVVNTWTIYWIFGQEGMPFVYQIVTMGGFHYVLLFIHNRKLLESLHVREENQDLFEVLKQKNNELERANLSQSRYLSAASHDLRQPLHALSLIADDVQRKNLNPQLTPSLERMEQAIESLGQSFDSMLNLSRLDAGIIKPRIKNIYLQLLFDRLRLEYEAMANRKKLSLHIVPTKVWVKADAGLLFSILSNLVSNAIRYTEQGSILVGVRRGQNQVRIMVYDTGIGIPKEKTQNIFEEYYRLDYAQQRVTGGVGLGLSISERMAKLLGAQMLVYSRLGKGSAFGVRLERSAPTPMTDTDSLDAVEIKADYLTGIRVALIEDDVVELNELENLFGLWGMDVSVILSSEMLAESVRDEGGFDLVVSDYHLGLSKETGLDILKGVRELQPGKPYCSVMITGDTTSDVVKLLGAEGIELLHKPVRPVRLRSVLNAIVRKMRLGVDANVP